MESTELSWIDGTPPDLADPPPGCPYAERCGLAGPRCRAEYPPEVSVGPEHRVTPTGAHWPARAAGPSTRPR